MSDDPFDIPDVPNPSDRQRGADATETAGGRRWPWLVAGIVLGVAAALLVPRFVTPYLPAPFRAGELRVQGPVLAEQQEEDRLLLTVETEQGAILATFRQQVSEIALLVDEGDTVTLGVREYRPFVRDPTLVGVYKGRPPDGARGTNAAPETDSRQDTMSQARPPAAGLDTAAPSGQRAPGAAPDEVPGADTTGP